jgi:hypothetical protein
MSEAEVWVEHDQTWRPARVVGRYDVSGRCRALVVFHTAYGGSRVQTCWCDELRPSAPQVSGGVTIIAPMVRSLSDGASPPDRLSDGRDAT